MYVSAALRLEDSGSSNSKNCKEGALWEAMMKEMNSVTGLGKSATAGTSFVLSNNQEIWMNVFKSRSVGALDIFFSAIHIDHKGYYRKLKESKW